MSNPLQQEAYNFSLKVLTVDKVEESGHSEDYLNPILHRDKTQEHKTVDAIVELSEKISNQGIVASPTRLTKSNRSFRRDRSSTAVMEQELEILQKDIYWENQTQASLEIEIDSSEIPHSTLQVNLWSTKKMSDEPKQKDDNCVIKFIDNSLVAEAFVSMKKLFRDDFFKYQFDQNKVFVTAEKEKVFRENLVQKGLDVGKIDGEVHIVSEPFIQQMICGVRTEAGITKTRLFLQNPSSTLPNSNSKTKLDSFPPEIQAIRDMSASLQDIIYEISTQENKHSASKYSVLNKQAIIKTLELTTHLKSKLGTSFNYQSKLHLFEAQESLISLGKRLLKYIDELSQDLQASSYSLLHEIATRKEFDLSSLGFEKMGDFMKTNANSFKFKNSSDSLRHFKSQVLIAQKYEKFLYETLEVVLNKMADYGMQPQEREFVALFLVIAFFRIPVFRKKLVTAIVESQGSKFKTHSSEFPDKTSNSYFLSHFDWDGEFYEVLNEDKRSEENKEILKNLFERLNAKWEERLGDKELIFLFTSEYFKYIQRQIHTKEMMPWTYLPGYLVVKANFLRSIEEHDFESLPSSLVNAISSLLPDETLFKTVFNIIVFKIQLRFFE